MHIADFKNAKILKYINEYCNSWYGYPWDATKTYRKVKILSPSTPKYLKNSVYTCKKYAEHISAVLKSIEIC